MMKYRVREGVVLQSVCGEYLLIATGSARECCPGVRRINAGGAYYWKLLEEGLDTGRMAELAADEYGATEEVLRPGLEKLLDTLETQNYILRDEE